MLAPGLLIFESCVETRYVMRKWLSCVSALCLTVLLAACGEEDTRDPLDWAIDPEVQGEERKILRAALAIVVAECPALADIDWEAEAKKDRKDWADGYFKPAWFTITDPKDVIHLPFIDGWTHFGRITIDDRQTVDYSLGFSWTEPPGIATEASKDPVRDARKQRICNYDEKRERVDGRLFWFKRVDALAGIVTD